MSSVLERALGGLRTVKASGAEEEEIASVDRAAHRAYRRGVEVAGWTALMEASAGLAVQVSFLAVLGIGGIRVASGALPVSSLIAFLLYLFLLSDPISTLVNGATQLQAGLAAAVRDAGAAGAAHRTHGRGGGPPWGRHRDIDRPRCRSPGCGSGTTSTEDSPWVHRDLTFELPPGGMTAIVGPSGTGKSTVFALLERYYEPHSGTIAVDGRDIRDWPLPELRATIGYVEQDTPILAGTLRDNLCLAAPDATEEDLQACSPSPAWTTCSSSCRRSWTRRSAIAAPPCPAASGSGSRSPGPCSAARASSCWTRPPPSSTPSTRWPCAP